MGRMTEIGTPCSNARPMLCILAATLAVVVAGAGVYVTSVEMRVVSAFERQIWLSESQRLKISIGPSCPLTLPELACSRIAREFPWALRVVYWSADTPTTLVSMPVPRR
jgi:hypothetical protein